MRISRNVSIMIAAGVAVAIVMTIAVISVTQTGFKSSFYGKELSANGSFSSIALIQTIPIPNVSGRIDHMTADITGRKLLFVAELENNSLDIIDLNAGKRIHTIDNGILNEPQGVLLIPEFGRIFVSNGQDGSVDVFDAKSFSLNKRIQLPSSDAFRNRLIYVGYGQAALGIINATDGSIVGNIKLTAHPESFQIEQTRSWGGQNNRIFVNVPGSNSIVVVDKQKDVALTTWSIPNAQNNFPMALDEGNHRLFVGTRDPAKLIVFDTDSGKVVSSLNITQDADDISYDVAKKRLYVSCGEGFINIIQQLDANHYNSIGNIPTASGARTSLFVPDLNRFYVAVPHHGGQESEIRVYTVR
ncbi:MAG: hypothetical protein WBF33_25345 [Candidatus Nitrosopolaris sp.]|jgi:DNA-binding beta-propeller fold protein YncE